MNYKPVPDEQLLAAIKMDDASAFAEIYDRYWYKLFSVAYHRIGMKEEAEELVHDVFESLWNKRREVSISHLGAYLVVAIKTPVDQSHQVANQPPEVAGVSHFSPDAAVICD